MQIFKMAIPPHTSYTICYENAFQIDILSATQNYTMSKWKSSTAHHKIYFLRKGSCRHYTGTEWPKSINNYGNWNLLVWGIRFTDYKIYVLRFWQTWFKKKFIFSIDILLLCSFVLMILIFYMSFQYSI